MQLPQSSVDAALETLHTRYQREDSGLCLLHLNTRWQLATKSQWADCVRRVLDSRRAVPLGPAAMETLTVIAYNQPVSRAFIEQVRGVDSSSSVSGLLERGSSRKPDVWICRVARSASAPPIPFACVRPVQSGRPAAGAQRCTGR